MLPLMRSKNQTHIYSLTAFGGLNPSYSHKVNELYAGINTSSELYPALSTSKTPVKTRDLSYKALGGGYFNKLYTVEKDEETGRLFLCTDNSQRDISEFSTAEEITDEETGEVIEAKERSLAFIKDEILIIPDNVIYHTNTDTAEAGCVSESVSEESAQAKFEKESETTDNMPMPYNIWYSGYITGNSFVSMSASYRPSSTSYKFYHFGLSAAFEIGDIITLKMAVKPIDATRDDAYKAYTKKMKNGISLKIKDLVKTTHSTPSGSVTEYTSVIFEDNAVDMGGYDEVFVYDITVEKGIPNFVDICSFENRMWGVTTDKLHASKLGDSSEWNDFTADSYGTLPSSSFATEVETDGSFTAITSYNGNIIAFKEDCIHKIYGSEPEEYTIAKLDCPGVKEGAKDTLALVGGVLYYMGKEGVYAYSGSMPRLISKDVINPGCSATHAGGNDRFYYIEITDGTENALYVYDTLCKVWHITDSPAGLKKILATPSGGFMICEREILMMNRASSGDWRFEFTLGEKEFSSKHICNVSARYSLEDSGVFSLYLKNQHDTYKLAEASGCADNKALTVRIPVSCDKDARLIFTGTGNFVLNSLDIHYRETRIND